MLRRLVERAPSGLEFRDEVRAALHPAAVQPAGVHPEDRGPNLSSNHSLDNLVGNPDLLLWHDVFVEQKLPWRRFLQSAVMHAAAVALIWTLSLTWIRQQNILRSAFDRSSLVTYTPEEYLPPLDTGASEAPQAKGDPAYAKQPILSVPREADNRSQTIVAPPDLRLNRDVPLPNIVATGAIVPAVPLDATQSAPKRLIAPDMQVVAPAPEVAFAPDRVVRAGIKSDVIAPPPEMMARNSHGVTSPNAEVIEPPPELQSAKGRAGSLNIGPSEAVAPAPQLALAEQHTAQARGRGRLSGGGVQPVGPPPSVSASGSSNPGGRLIALGIHPVVPSGPVAVPGGNRRGTFSANPQGKQGAAGTPDLVGSKSDAKGAGRGNLPAGLRVGAADANARLGAGSGSSHGDEDAREVASASSSGAATGKRLASAIADDKITDEDRKVFGGKRVYGRTLNMPNLNSSTGSWVIKFAELNESSRNQERKQGDLLEPVATEKSDPGYPLELIRANVHGMVTLYAVIHADGKVGEIRVLNSPDERLDAYAAKALARWKFVPAERAGKPVALEAVVEIPFRVHRSF
jgi:TonB family protein